MAIPVGDIVDGVIKLLKEFIGPIIAYFAGKAKVRSELAKEQNELQKEITGDLLDDGAWVDSLRDKADKRP